MIYKKVERTFIAILNSGSLLVMTDWRITTRYKRQVSTSMNMLSIRVVIFATSHSQAISYRFRSYHFIHRNHLLFGQVCENSRTGENPRLRLGFSLICSRILPNVRLGFHQAQRTCHYFLNELLLKETLFLLSTPFTV